LLACRLRRGTVRERRNCGQPASSVATLAPQWEEPQVERAVRAAVRHYRMTECGLQGCISGLPEEFGAAS